MTLDGLRRDLESALAEAESAESRYHIRQALQRLNLVERTVAEHPDRSVTDGPPGGKRDRDGTRDETEERTEPR